MASGGYAYEIEYYDDNGNMVGLRGYDCGLGRSAGDHYGEPDHLRLRSLQLIIRME